VSPTASPARECALKVVRRVFEHGAYADRALHAEARELEPRERALAGALVYGTVQRRATLDAFAATLVNRSLNRLEAPVLAALRLGLFQILFLGGVADHAAVNETVALVKPLSPGGAGLTNAVLRRATREGAAWLASLRDDTPADAAVAHSIPAWLAERWFDELGAESARALMAAVNRPAETALRVNPLVAQVQEVIAELPLGSRPAPGLPEALVLDGAFDAFGSPLWERGALMPQSRGSMLVARALAPPAGAALLDLCAAPGAKTTHLAALGARRVIAVERNPRRAERLKETAARMRAAAVAVRELDAAIVGSPVAPVGLGPEDRFDGVLVDPPCSGLGTLQSRPDIRWHAGPEQIEELAALQARILAAGARATRPGGALVYSVCTISKAEGERVVEDFLLAHRDFAPEPLGPRHPEFAAAAQGPYLQLRPDRDGTDGFFIARLLRAQ
jgi:16S rRNA (cytosine967-C5)-methyltransferase